MVVHQLLSGAGPVDAVTGQALAYRDLFRRWGMDGGVHAAAVEPAARGQVEPLSRLRAEEGDLLLFHYSAYAPRLEPLLDELTDSIEAVRGRLRKVKGVRVGRYNGNGNGHRARARAR